jgi:hypothetical protein
MTNTTQTPANSFESLLTKSGAKELYRELGLPEGFSDRWVATKEDKEFAWDLYTELRSRIITQPLHFLHGHESAALKSIHELFPYIRNLIHDKGVQAANSAELSLAMINKVIRPFTAKWHRRIDPDVPLREDQGTLFRRELSALQAKVQVFEALLGCIARDDYLPGNLPTPEHQVLNLAEVNPETPTEIPFAIQFHGLVPKKTAEAITKAEQDSILARRKQVNLASAEEKLKDVAGLAISGGGIRSASFALGVVQELSRHNVLQHFDYLSTVSGGGYLGSFLSSYLNGRPGTAVRESKKQADIGLGSDQLPLNSPSQVGQGVSHGDAHRAQSESVPIRHLRGHSKYLLTGGLQNRLTMIVLGVFGILANLIILLPFVAAILLSVVLLRPNAIEHRRSSLHTFADELVSDETSLACLSLVPILILSLAVVFSIFRFVKREKFALCWLGIVSFLVPIALLVVLWRLLPWGLVLVHDMVSSKRGDSNALSSWFTSVASISAVIMFLQRYWSLLNANPSMSKIKRTLTVVVLGLFGPIFLLAFLFLLANYTILNPWHDYPPALSLGVLTLAPLFFGLLFLDINQSSLHPFYRRKLSEAFVIAQNDSSDEVVSNDTLKLSQMRDYNQSGPYHLINAALNAPSSDNGAMRERGTDFFMFSQAYSGSASTGYFPTKEWEKRDSRLNLGTAMAISGAAASPVMGVVPLPSAKFLMAIFNVRLDFWLSVPRRPMIPFLWWTPGPWYLIRQAIGWMDEKSTFVNLSDGGHIENLGLYELLRRRCRYIVVIDGECDPKIECGALMQAARFAKLDFGVKVQIDLDRFRIKQDGSVSYHFSFGEICYPRINQEEPEELRGQILYIKLSRSGNEPAGVEHYRLLNPDFPHQSTADQFFDEAQFEAYRCLGEHIAEDIFAFANIKSNENSPTRLKEWFQEIERKIKDPNMI